MRSKEAFAYSRGTGYFCSVAAPFRRVTPRRAGAGHDATGRVMTMREPRPSEQAGACHNARRSKSFWSKVPSGFPGGICHKAAGDSHAVVSRRGPSRGPL
jgi:hypothetical protein